MENRDEILRKALFVPCKDKKSLHRWIEVYLGVDFPDTKVDPASTSSPMDVLWEIYSKAIANDDPNFQRVLVYASRDSFKTLASAVLEVLAVLHMERSVAHEAAIQPQAAKAQSYVKKFFRRPYLRDYMVGDNVRRIDVIRYYDPVTGDNLTKAQYEALAETEKGRYEEKSYYIVVVICTLQGANSEHVPFMVIDEVDVIPKQHLKAYEESQMIPCVWQGKLPITLLISTRKFAFGQVAREIENADVTGLHIRHWNLIDVTERCPTTRHLPHLPRVNIYWSEDTLRAISEDQYQELLPDQKGKYTKTEGFAGCLSRCKIFAACQGRLAGASQLWTKSSLLKPIDFTIQAFRSVSVPTALAQLLCRKPSSEGLIYPTLDREQHILTAGQIVSKITGEPSPAIILKDDLFRFLLGRDIKWVCGIDWGFTHNMAVVLMAVDGMRAYVVGAISKPECDPAEKLELLDRVIKPFNPIVYADTEAPDMNKLLKKNGYRVRDWNKGPGSVLGGIETVRLKLNPGIGDPHLYFLDGDDGVSFVFQRHLQYHWAIGADGKPSNEPDDTGDDECDALRYAVMNTFKPKGQITVAPETETRRPTSIYPENNQGTLSQTGWAKSIIEEATGQSQDKAQSEVKGKKGSFVWDL